ncbi:EboA domain-containing protein [Streptomyces azureus]|uniref:Sugar phosphate isomerase/epimerase n=1 Tax=Streptomyces azureus TaxID=146537 RepID=A0A0K8PPC5_STRAJ|nr:EboA domain-containing protein [Streptomyces azureus]GAP49722.1 sugar phosphate isomerase/epimerase [Streptomyces azureus]
MTHPRTTPAARTGGPQDDAPAHGDTAARDAQGPESAAAPDAQAPEDANLLPTTDTHSTQPTLDTALASSPADLRRHLTTHLDPAARAWLEHALDEAAAHPGLHGPISAWELRLAEAGRRCGAAYADAARVLILDAARAGTDALTRVYFQGTAGERRAVLHALPHLVSGPGALPLVEDALRTNDTRLLTAAVGPYAARHLAPHDWRHAVLKCLFTGVPVDRVADLPRRARGDGELARMLGDYAAERTAAGRTVPEDLYRVLDLTESAGPAPGTDHPHGKES